MHFQLGENYVDLYYIRDWKLNKAAGWNKGEGGWGVGVENMNQNGPMVEGRTINKNVKEKIVFLKYSISTYT